MLLERPGEAVLLRRPGEVEAPAEVYLCQGAAGELHGDGHVVPVADGTDLRDEGVGGGEDLGGVLAQDPGDHVDVVDGAVVEDAAADLEVVQGGQGRVPGGRLGILGDYGQYGGAGDHLDHLDMAEVAGPHPLSHGGEGWVKPVVGTSLLDGWVERRRPPVEATEKWAAHAVRPAGGGEGEREGGKKLTSRSSVRCHLGLERLASR